MSVGPINGHFSVLCGHLTLTVTDGEGNILAIRRHGNLINTMGKRLMASCLHNGGAGVSAIYAYVYSGMNGTPTLSMVNAFSTYGTLQLNATNIPATLTWSFHNDTQWSLNGTMSFVGYGGFSSIDAAAIAWTPTTSAGDLSCTQWFAMACFTDLAINSVDRISFNWAFSLSTTTSTAV